MMYNSLRPYVDNSGTSEVLDCYVEDHALLFVCQHPTKVKAASTSTDQSFTKQQKYHLNEHANLVLVDWYDSSESIEGKATAVVIDSQVEVNLKNQNVLSLVEQQVSSNNQRSVAIGGTIVVKGERVRKVSEQIMSLPKFRPHSTVTTIGVKRNRGSSSNLLSLEDVEENKAVDGKKHHNSSDPDTFIYYDAVENDEEVFSLRFKASSLELGLALVSLILQPLEKELKVNASSLPWAHKFDPMYHGKLCTSLL